MIRLVYALIATVGLLIASNYVAQSRYEQIGAKPCAEGACVLMYDHRLNEYFWQALPPLPDRDIIPRVGV